MVSRRRISRLTWIAGGGLLVFALSFAAACGGDDGDGVELPDLNGDSTPIIPATTPDPLTPEAEGTMDASPTPTGTAGGGTTGAVIAPDDGGASFSARIGGEVSAMPVA